MTKPKLDRQVAGIVDFQLKCLVAELKGARLARGLTQQEVADACGIHQGTLSFIETGRQDPSVRVLLVLAHYFDMPVTLWTGDPQ